MSTPRDVTGAEMMRMVIDVLGEIKQTPNMPDTTRDRCDHYCHSFHDTFHDLATWLRELMEWAPMQPQTRDHAIQVAEVLRAAEAPFKENLKG